MMDKNEKEAIKEQLKDYRFKHTVIIPMEIYNDLKLNREHNFLEYGTACQNFKGEKIVALRCQYIELLQKAYLKQKEQIEKLQNKLENIQRQFQDMAENFEDEW